MTPRRWEGAACGAEDLVALGLIANGGKLQWFKSPRRTATVGLGVSLHPTEPVPGGEYVVVQVAGSVGNTLSRGGRSLSVVRPQTITGRPLLLARVEGDSQIEVGVLLLAAGDVKFGRNRLWRVRQERVRGVPEPFATILASGRSGTA